MVCPLPTDSHFPPPHLPPTPTPIGWSTRRLAGRSNIGRTGPLPSSKFQLTERAALRRRPPTVPAPRAALKIEWHRVSGMCVVYRSSTTPTFLDYIDARKSSPR